MEGLGLALRVLKCWPLLASKVEADLGSHCFVSAPSSCGGK